MDFSSHGPSEEEIKSAVSQAMHKEVGEFRDELMPILGQNSLILGQNSLLLEQTSDTLGELLDVAHAAACMPAIIGMNRMLENLAITMRASQQHEHLKSRFDFAKQLIDDLKRDHVEVTSACVIKTMLFMVRAPV